MKVAFVLLGIIFALIGVIFIYDARKLTKKVFSFQDINDGTKALKVLGVIVTILGLCLIYIYLPESIEILKKM